MKSARNRLETQLRNFRDVWIGADHAKYIPDFIEMNPDIVDDLIEWTKSEGTNFAGKNVYRGFRLKGADVSKTLSTFLRGRLSLTMERRKIHGRELPIESWSLAPFTAKRFAIMASSDAAGVVLSRTLSAKDDVVLDLSLGGEKELVLRVPKSKTYRQDSVEILSIDTGTKNKRRRVLPLLEEALSKGWRLADNSWDLAKFESESVMEVMADVGKKILFLSGFYDMMVRRPYKRKPSR